MKVPANSTMPIEEYFIQLRDSTYVPLVLDLPLMKKAKTVFTNELVEKT